MSKMSVRFLIDKEQRQVLFAEAKSDFIDVLFSFLTLPLGTIVRLLGKQSGLGSLDNLYESVEQLDPEELQTEACKEMLLNPRCVAAELCEDLKIKNIHCANPRTFYYCNGSDCVVQSKCYYTYVTKGRCGRCGKVMDQPWYWLKHTSEKGGIFVNDTVDFIITHDLRVMPNSTTNALSLIKELGIKDTRTLEERVIDFGTEETLNLLRRSLVFKSPLTEVCFPNKCIEPRVKSFSTDKEKIDVTKVERKVNVNIILNKKTNNVLFAEVGGDFLNLLLSFLAFPLGSVFRLLDNHILSESCISNLYSSMKSLDLQYFKSEKCKNMFVFTELASYYGCGNQMLKLDEMTSKSTSFTGCLKCYKDNVCKLWLTSPCKHGITKGELIEQNPKLKNEGSDFVGAFVHDSRRFKVVDNLHISRLSAVSAITKGMDCNFSDVVVKEVNVDNAKILSLLSAMLISKTVLTDVFSTKPVQRRRCQYM